MRKLLVGVTFYLSGIFATHVSGLPGFVGGLALYVVAGMLLDSFFVEKS